MKRSIIWYIALILILVIFFRFSRFIIILAIKFWYVSIPLVLYLSWRYRKKRQERKISGFDPQNEIKTYPPPSFDDDEKNGK